MNPLQIAFIVINIVVPYWIWSDNRTDAGKGPKIDWQSWTQNMKRLVEASGKNSCRSVEMVDKIRGLCHQSEARFSEHESVVFEQVVGNTLFACTVKKDYLLVKFYPYKDADADAGCQIEDKHRRIQVEPEFLFTYAGFVNTISFSTPNGTRESVPVRNCRNKLKFTKSAMPTSIKDAEERLGHLAGDPADFHTGNRLCLSYDAAAAWRPWRDKLFAN